MARLFRTTTAVQRAAGFVAVFVVIGVVLLIAVHAATPSNVSVTLQNSTLSGPASLIADSTALNGQAVEFNSGSATPPAGGGGTGTGAAGELGVALGSGWNGLSSTELNTDFADMQSIGAKWVRFDIEWSGVQPNNSSSYNWTSYDNVAKAAQAHNLKVLGILDAAPTWAQQSSCAGQYACPPNGTSAFATFAAAAATHYAPMGVTAWEIYNEENTSSFWLNPNAASYTALLKAAYTAIHQAASGETVVSGGLAPSGASPYILPNTYAQQMYAAGVKGYFDAFGDHPYCFSDPITYCATNNSGSTDGWGMMAYGPNNIESIMKANGDSSKKIWMTEFGAPDGNYSTTDQAKVLQQAYNLTSNQSWAGPIFWYTYTNDEGFGLIDSNGNPKPVYTTFKQLTGK